jgi:alcohol dehydrogenase
MLNSPLIAIYRAKQSILKVIGGIMPMPTPTLFSGPGASLELCEAISQVGTQSILIVTDAMLVEIGLVKKITDALNALGVRTVVYSGVLPDPTFDHVDEGIALAKKESCEAVLAVGGGSSIDAAKIISAGAAIDKPVRKMVGLFRVRKPCLRLYAIPTTAGTGSEVSPGAVISDPVTHEKYLIADPKITPLMAAIDASLMLGLPPSITAATGMDAFTHAIESYISRNSTLETKGYSLMATRIISSNLIQVTRNGQDLDARHKMGMASFYGGLAIKGGLGYVHSISHAFSALYRIPHGLGNAIVLPYVLEYSKESIIDALAELATAAGLNNKNSNGSSNANSSNRELADTFIAYIHELNKALDIPEHLAVLNAIDIPKLAALTLKEAHGIYAVPKYMNQKDCENVIGKMLAIRKTA